MLIDVHCHLDFKDFENDLDKVISRCKDFSVLISNGTDPKSNRKVLELSKKYKIIKPALGFYPTDVTEAREEEIEKEIEFIRKSKPIAIGEVGLDYFKGEKQEKQKSAFRKFIRLAAELDIPIIVHSRKAEKDTLDILEESEIKKVIMHCFGGNLKETKRAEELDYMFSIPTSILRNKTFKKLVKRVNLNSILTETDAPFLSPYENIKRNEPSFIKETIKKIAEIKKLSEEEVKDKIYENYKRIFNK